MKWPCTNSTARKHSLIHIIQLGGGADVNGFIMMLTMPPQFNFTNRFKKSHFKIKLESNFEILKGWSQSHKTFLGIALFWKLYLFTTLVTLMQWSNVQKSMSKFMPKNVLRDCLLLRSKQHFQWNGNLMISTIFSKIVRF
jgi:hypothetical protein